MTLRPPYQKYAVDVRPSAIDGQGAFAAEPIAGKRKIGEIRGESITVAQARIRATRSERIMIVELSDRKAIDFSRSADPMRYTNHSCPPNARLCIRTGRVDFYALRDRSLPPTRLCRRIERLIFLRSPIKSKKKQQHTSK